MPDPGLLEQNKQKQPEEIFRTQQIQDSVQLQQNHMQQDVFAQTQTQVQKTEQSTARKKRFGIFNKEKKEEPYTTTKKRKNDFVDRLLTSSEEHLNGEHSAEFTEVINKIREYAKLASKKENDKVGEKLMEVKSMIQNYISAKSSDPNAAEDEELKTIKLYEMWFDSFANGSLQIPSNVNKDHVTIDCWKQNFDGITCRMIDMSNQPLFVGEPNVTEVYEQGKEKGYFMEHILQVLMIDPMAIKRAMRDNGETVTVRIYDPVKEGNKTIGLRPRYITVSKMIQVTSTKEEKSLYSRGCWVEILKKIYDYGDDMTVMLLGKQKETIKIGDYSRKSEQEERFNDMKQALEQGELVRSVATGLYKKDILRSGGFYEVRAVYERDGKKFVKLRDPMASAEFRYVRTVGPNREEDFQRERFENSAKKNAILELELGEFLEKSSQIDIIKKGNMLDAE